MTPKKEIDSQSTISEAKVAEYLDRHPGFFQNHEALLKTLVFHHKPGAAISLIERQVSLFRQKNQSLQKEMDDAVKIAREHAWSLNLIKRLAIELTAVTALHQALEIIDEKLRTEIGINITRLFLTDPEANYPSQGMIQSTQMRQAKMILGPSLRNGKPLFGAMDDDQRKYLFAETGPQIKNALIVPIGPGAEVGLLAAGCFEETALERKPYLDFFIYIGQILEQLILNLNHEP